MSCGGNCGAPCCTTGTQPRWIPVTGAPQRWGAAAAMPQPLMAGFDPEPLGGCDDDFMTSEGASPSNPGPITHVNVAAWVELAEGFIETAKGEGANVGALLVELDKAKRDVDLPAIVRIAGDASCLARGEAPSGGGGGGIFGLPWWAVVLAAAAVVTHRRKSA